MFLLVLVRCVVSYTPFKDPLKTRFQVPIELMDHMHEIYQRSLDKYGAEVGCYTPPRLLEDKVGTTLRSPGFEKWTYDVENSDGALHIRHSGIDLPK